MTTAALVTLFYPDENVIKNIEKLSEQTTRIFLLDNTPENPCNERFSHIKNAEYISFEKNLGLSSAFNKALKEITFLTEADFILFFDQDSCITKNFIQNLVNGFQELSKTQRIGLLGPVYFDSTKKKYGGITKHCEKISQGFFLTTEIITSGMITTYKILENVGFWDEGIFLDYADFELCWKMIQNGFEIFITENALLNHSLGSGFLNVNLIFKKLCLSYSPPLREYYQTREAVKFLKRDYVPKNWRKNFLFNLTIRILIFIFRLPQKFQRLKYFFLGIKDGLKNKSGELQRNL